ncbi:MAG: DJ-1/PfpI family protein [Caldilineaceae bacterium]
MQKRTVAVLIFPGVELLDFAGPFMSLAPLVPAPKVGTVSWMFSSWPRCRTQSGVNNPVTVVADYMLPECPAADIVVVPGGQGTRTAIDRPKLVDWIAARAQQAELMTSVCTGSFLLAKAGLLTGKAATTHWGSIERMRNDFPDVAVRENTRWVDAGDVVSSSGVSAGIDMALYVLQRLYGTAIAAATARGIEYDHWQ